MGATQSHWPASLPPASGTMEVLTFTLGTGESGIELAKVQELRSYDAVRPVADAPDFIRGTIDLPGSDMAILEKPAA